MALEKQRFQIQDLVLKIKKSVNRAIWDEDRYEAFIDQLCGDREYQKLAIKTALCFMLSQEYSNTRSLARYNWEINGILHDRYGTWENFERHLQFPNQLSATLDLATGTGKSYVIYGIAMILLAEGVVDRVLVLCPSRTIEQELLRKFRELTGNQDLTDLLPANAKITIPSIISADQTIIPGSICVENRDAVYEHVKSSIKDSLWGKGAQVAVLNDEAHHIANDPLSQKKKWKEFLENTDYGFKYILGFSGTCYVQNEYFADVIYRYSIREAIEQKYVKNIRYIAEEPKTGEQDERWQLVYNRHLKLKKDLSSRKILPLTIVITPNIKRCKEVGAELAEFLVEKGGYTDEQANKRILIVYNNAPDIAKLKGLDDPTSEIEWIVSVSMLNEGWDVKRVFQIVPHEERAFNSKLLIAQVLGRGLRIPEQWKGDQPEVTVFNHAAWATGIRHLINEVLENERRISSKVEVSSQYNFDLYNLKYDIEVKSEEKRKKRPFTVLHDDIIDLPSEAESIEVNVDFEKAISGTRDTWKTVIRRKMYTPEEVAAQMFNTLQYLDMETSLLPDPKEHTCYSKEYPYERLLSIVLNSLQGDKLISERNRQRLLSAIGTIRRPSTKVVRYQFKSDHLMPIHTTQRPADSVSAGQLARDKVMFYTERTYESLVEEQLEFFYEAIEPDSGYKTFPVQNTYDFKTPLNMVIADAGTERHFIRELVSPNNAGKIDAWIKSTQNGFYGIDYAWRKGEHAKRGIFNPDFFIKQGNVILVIEIKDDGELTDPSAENIKKNEFTIAHFAKLNEKLREECIDQVYYFHFLTPQDFPEFFKRLREGTISTFRSKLDVVLKEAGSYDRQSWEE